MVFREHDNSWVRIVKHDAWLHLSRVILDYRYDQLLMSYINPDPAYWSVIAPLGMSKLNMLKTGLFQVLPRIVCCLLPIVTNNN